MAKNKGQQQSSARKDANKASGPGPGQGMIKDSNRQVPSSTSTEFSSELVSNRDVSNAKNCAKCEPKCRAVTSNSDFDCQ